jgi:predicted transcriptional regulator
MDKKMGAKAVYKIFRKMRMDLGLSQMALGKTAGLSSDKLARWEKGLAKFNDEEMDRLGKALDAALIARSESAPGPLTSVDSQALKRNRRAFGITQEEFARRAGLSQTTISTYENGHVALDAEQMEKVKKAINSLMAERGAGKKISLKSLMSARDYKPYSSFGAEPVERLVSPEDQNRALREQVLCLKEVILCQKKLLRIAGEIDRLKDERWKEQGPIDADIEESFRREIVSLEEQKTALEDKIAATEKKETIPGNSDD